MFGSEEQWSIIQTFQLQTRTHQIYLLQTFIGKPKCGFYLILFPVLCTARLMWLKTFSYYCANESISCSYFYTTSTSQSSLNLLNWKQLTNWALIQYWNYFRWRQCVWVPRPPGQRDHLPCWPVRLLLGGAGAVRVWGWLGDAGAGHPGVPGGNMVRGATCVQWVTHILISVLVGSVEQVHL